MARSDFLHEATERGFVFQCTDAEGLDAALRAGPVTAYIGFDCTADSLHVGNLVGIMILRLFQKHGHRPLVLMGGGGWPWPAWIYAVLIASAVVAAFALLARRIGLQVHLEWRR